MGGHNVRLEEGAGFTPVSVFQPSTAGENPTRPVSFRDWPWNAPLSDADIRRQVELLMDERGQATLATQSPTADADLRVAQARIEFLENERDLLRRLADRPAARPSASSDGPSSSGPFKVSQPREYSPRGNVGPSKWLMHMALYFEYARTPEEDRVRHAMILLKDAAESWWQSHMRDTTDADGHPTADRIATWPVFCDRLKQ